MKTILHTPKAPAAIGPYSQAVRWGDMLFCSGQIALLPNGDDSLLNEDVAIQCRQALENMEAILIAAGTGWENVVKVNVSWLTWLILLISMLFMNSSLAIPNRLEPVLR